MKKCGLLGKNINYSKSPEIHNEYYMKNKIHLKYEIFDINEEEISGFIKYLKSKDIVGFNVTIPYKEIVIKYLTKLIYPADRIGAVNTVTVTNNGLVGYNTDYYGFIKSIEKYGINLKARNALVIGSGGAAKCIYCALKDLQCFNIDLAVRNLKNIDTDFFQCNNVYSLNNNNDYSKYDILVNCTPLGGANYINSSPINVDTIKSDTIVFDLNYNPEKSRLLKDAERKGAKIINGESMLIFQAHAAADVWINEIKGGI